MLCAKTASTTQGQLFQRKIDSDIGRNRKTHLLAFAPQGDCGDSEQLGRPGLIRLYRQDPSDMGFFQLPQRRDVILSFRNTESAAVQFSRPAARTCKFFTQKSLFLGREISSIHRRALRAPSGRRFSSDNVKKIRSRTLYARNLFSRII